MNERPLWCDTVDNDDINSLRKGTIVYNFFEDVTCLKEELSNLKQDIDELMDGYTMINDASDLEMRDGDLARAIAQRFVHKHRRQ